MNPLDPTIRVTFRVPVHFTSGVFAPDNRVLRTVIAEASGRQPSDTLAVIDAGVARAHPTLVEDVARYARAHGDVIRLAGPPLDPPTWIIGPEHPEFPAEVDSIADYAQVPSHLWVGP